MIALQTKIKRVFLCLARVDFRKRHDGLLGEAYRLGLEPFSGDAVIFIGRDKKRIKVLYADNNGLWESYKRFNKGAHRMKFIFDPDSEAKKIRLAELSLLLDGADYTVTHTKKDFPENE
jgi:transposase